MTLTDKEREFLLMVFKRQDTCDPVCPKQVAPLEPRFQTLVDRGYLRSVRLIDGIFHQWTGEVCFKLTEAAEMILGLVVNPPDEPPDEPPPRPGLDM